MKDLKNYAVVVLCIAVVVLLSMLRISNNSVKKAEADVKSWQEKLSLVRVAVENPVVTQKPKVIVKIRKVPVIKEVIKEVQDPELLKQIDEMNETITTMIFDMGSSESIPPSVANILSGISLSSLKSKHKWHPLLAYNFTNKYVGIGMNRSIYKSILVGVRYNTDDSIEAQMQASF